MWTSFFFPALVWAVSMEALSVRLEMSMVVRQSRSLSIQRDKMGKPEIFPKNELYKYMKEKFGNFLIHVSLSDTKKYSIASVIIEKT